MANRTEYHRKYYQEHKDCVTSEQARKRRESQRKYRQTHDRSEYFSKYYQEHKERYKERARENYQKRKLNAYYERKYANG